MADDFFYLPISDLRKIARIRFGKDLFRIGEAPLGSGGGFFPENWDDDPGIPAPDECCFILEDASGEILVEDGSGCVTPEFCAAPGESCLILEDNTGDILQENNAGCISQEM